MWIQFSRGDHNEEVILVTAETCDESLGALNSCPQDQFVVGCIALKVQKVSCAREMDESFFLEFNTDEIYFCLQHLVKHMHTGITESADDIMV